MKRFIVIILCIGVLIQNIFFCYTVKAAEIMDLIQAYPALKELLNDMENRADNGNLAADIYIKVLKQYLSINGFTVNDALFNLAMQDLEDFKSWLTGHSTGGHSFGTAEDSTTQDFVNESAKYFVNNITLNDNSKTITFNDNSRQFLINTADYIKSKMTSKIIYSFDVQASTVIFGSDLAVPIAGLCNDNPDDVFILNCNGSYDASLRIIQVQSLGSALYVVGGNSGDYYGGQLWEAHKENGVLACKMITCDSKHIIKVYGFSNGELVDYTEDYKTRYVNRNFAWGWCYKEPNFSAPSKNFMKQPVYISTNKRSFEYFENSSYLQEYLNTVGVGNAPYYTTNTWNDFSNSTGDYTVDSNNVNTVTYNDIVNNNQNYYDDHGTYPNPTQTQEYINNTNNDNRKTIINNYYNGGTVSGNGSGSSGNIFGWLSKLGDVLGNFIKNIGELIVKLVDSIANIITSITDKLPNLFTPLLKYIFEWLPDDYQALIGLAIVAMVTVGIIKVIKG